MSHECNETDEIGPSINLFFTDYNKGSNEDQISNSDVETNNLTINTIVNKEDSSSDIISDVVCTSEKENTDSKNVQIDLEKVETVKESSSVDDLGPSLDLFKQDSEHPVSKPPKKIKKGCEFAEIHLNSLPKAKYYQLSYMHRTPLTHVQFSKTGYLATASIDGNVKFWKKGKAAGLDLVKMYRAHLDSVTDLKMSFNGEYCATTGADKTVKIFDILNCDMINIIKLDFLPYCCSWIYSDSDASKYLAVSEAENHCIYILNVFKKDAVIKKLDKLHEGTVNIIIYNVRFGVVVSMDIEGMIEYWKADRDQLGELPSLKEISFEFKTDTDLYELFNQQTVPITACFAPNGRIFAVYSSDRKLRIFDFKRGKLLRTLDESIQSYTDTDKAKEIASMELGRRLAVEKELERNEFRYNISMEFDYSSNFLIYPSLMGVKIVDVRSLEVYRILGIQEPVRFLGLAVSPVAAQHHTDPSLFLYTEDTETVEDKEARMPLIVCSGFKRNRLYLFTNNEPLQTTDVDGNVEIERDILNEKPTKEEISASNSESKSAGGNNSRLTSTKRLCPTTDSAGGSGSKNARRQLENFTVIHTSIGDIQAELYPLQTPRTVENFVTHSRHGFYNGRIFHRVIKHFMIQSGCPHGDGSGGHSIWGGEFEDEFHPSLRQDKAFLICMANMGERNTNGSQFFITVKPCPWLENKHTIFGRVIKGMEIVQKINGVSTDKNDKPIDDIYITSVSVKHVL